MSLSYQDWVNEIISSGKVSHALIMTKSGAFLADSESSKPSEENLATLGKSFNQNVDRSLTSIVFNKNKYIIIKWDEESLIGKYHKEGLLVVNAGDYIVIGLTTEDQNMGNASVYLEKYTQRLRFSQRR